VLILSPDGIRWLMSTGRGLIMRWYGWR
jgi:hypothetical protein